MPYISGQERRDVLKYNGPIPNNAGELNYLLTTILNKYLFEQQEHLSYSVQNEIMGVLSCVQSEFYRRIMIPYEDQKVHENGDVWELP